MAPPSSQMVHAGWLRQSDFVDFGLGVGLDIEFLRIAKSLDPDGCD
jgi:hypothetical protein